MTTDPGKPLANGHLRRVVSVCELKDIAAWRIASRQIARHIAAQEYHLICPDAQLAEFEHASHPAWEILGESGYWANCHPDMIRARVAGSNADRVHWLFQQFVKINVVCDSGLDDDDLVLIWDADTVPLRPIEFVDAGSGKVCYYHGTEHHRPYFETIERLLGFGKVSRESFIAQCLPVRARWVREVVREIESRFGMPYVEAVLGLLPGQSGSEFSEYETIGSWVLRHHRDAMMFRPKNRWLRGGLRIFGADPSGIRATILMRLLAIHYDFVAVETWYRPITFHRIARALSKCLPRRG